jgi:hypothetical protein
MCFFYLKVGVTNFFINDNTKNDHYLLIVPIEPKGKGETI